VNGAPRSLVNTKGDFKSYPGQAGATRDACGPFLFKYAGARMGSRANLTAAGCGYICGYAVDNPSTRLRGRALSGTLPKAGSSHLAPRTKPGRPPMVEHTKFRIWDIAAGTFIAISVVSSLAFFVASAIH